MDTNNIIAPVAAILVAFLFALLGALFTRRGFWSAFFLFFPIIFLVGWSGQLWISPLGPTWLSVPWLTLLFVGVIFSFLIIALSAPVKTAKDESSAAETSGLVLGAFFWFLIVILLLSIILGYYNIPPELVK